jgi:excisionase family DNA binding protein
MADERLAYSLPEAASMLGGVSVRSLQRLVARGVLPTVRIGRRVLVPAERLFEFVAGSTKVAHTPACAEPVAWKGSKPCYSNAQDRRAGTSGSGTQAAGELSVLLARLTGGKQKSLKGSGG